MSTSEIFDRIPEETVVLSPQSLNGKRHLPVPPSLTVCIRDPRSVLSLYALLTEEYPQTHALTLLRDGAEVPLTVADLNTDDDAVLNGAEYLVIPPLPEQYAFETFQNTIAILRGPHGCPWDRKQTHQSLRNYLLEESYELLDALDRKDRDAVCEEMGDVLLQLVLHAQIACDEHDFTMGDVIAHINDKMIFRHEHVFGSPEAIDPDQVSVRWEKLKQKERAGKKKSGGPLDGIPTAMPSLSVASAYQRRAVKLGFDWDEPCCVWDKLNEESAEFKAAETPEERQEELGDVLFCVSNIARTHGIDPEAALREANLKFRDRFHYVESRVREQGKDLFEIPLEEKKKYWNEYKVIEQSAKKE